MWYVLLLLATYGLPFLTWWSLQLAVALFQLRCSPHHAQVQLLQWCCRRFRNSLGIQEQLVVVPVSCAVLCGSALRYGSVVLRISAFSTFSACMVALAGCEVVDAAVAVARFCTVLTSIS